MQNALTPLGFFADMVLGLAIGLGFGVATALFGLITRSRSAP